MLVFKWVLNRRVSILFWNLSLTVNAFSVWKVCVVVMETPVGMLWPLWSSFFFILLLISGWVIVPAWEKI